MDKLTDRILWSIFVLSIGVSLFIFGKPALVNLTNQVLHHDDLKATIQAPSLTSADVQRISAVNNDIGVSKHAYILASTNGLSDFDLWWLEGQPRQISFPHEVQTTPIPYGSYLKAIIKIKVDKPVEVAVDINNFPPAGVSAWNNNDNDDTSMRALIIDGKSVSSGYFTWYAQTTLTPDTWHTIEIEYDNFSTQNTSKVALYDGSDLMFRNNNDCNVSVQTKDAIFAVDAIQYRS